MKRTFAPFVVVLAIAAPAFAQAPSASAPPKPAASAPAKASVSAASVSASASASTAPGPVEGTALPPGHPPMPTGESQGAAPGQALPPGHPAMGDEDDGMQMPNIPRDEARDDASLPAGTISATIKDEKDAPVAGVVVTLGIVRTSVAQGEARSQTTATTDSKGEVVFRDLKRGSGWAYRVSVVNVAPEDPSAIATYGAEPFNLPLDHGFRVLVHRFPVSSKIDKLLAAVEGVDTIIEVRDDVVEVSQMFDVVNAGTTTWALGKGLTLALPKGFKGLRAGEAMEDHQVAPIEGVGAKWTGSFPPGRSRLTYEFKVPYEGDPSVAFDIELPPRVLAARVRVPTRRGMTLAVDGFPAARDENAGTGVKLLSTTKQGTPQDEVHALKIHIGGLPTEGPERSLAALFALLGIGGGLWFAFRTPPASDRRATRDARTRLRTALLDELAALDRAKKARKVGPKAYARERAKLIDRIADTLDPEELEPGDGEPAPAR